ncbi:MAG: hypothetical protein QNJ41_25285 [Xenococcaceae cyanobacterium MO_188.B32]|nr:hypothetical protein [Xenococcaceae cyanobacterium MO_188.B32]
MILLLATNGDLSEGNDSIVTPLGNILALSSKNIIAPSQLLLENNATPPKNPSTSIITGENQIDNIEGVNTVEVPEPSAKHTFFILSCLFFLFNRQRVMI